MTRGINKSVFVSAMNCDLLGWLLRNEDDTVCGPPTLAEEFRLAQGLDIGQRARRLFPAGILVERSWDKALEQTEKLLKDQKAQLLFEPAFSVDEYLTRVDVLQRKSGGWRMIEVKSAATPDIRHIDDMAYTVMVLDRWGLKVNGVFLMLVSKDYRLGMEDNKLFVVDDCTNKVLARVEEFKPFWELVEKKTRGARPQPKLAFICRKCQIFEECIGSGVKNHIFDIPRLSEQKFKELVSKGITRIEDISESFPLTPNQDRVRRCVKSGKPYIGDGLAQELANIVWPAYYLDFENVSTAVPLYPDVAPYEKIPTQYSIHKCSQLGKIVAHRDYLAEPAKDCREELAERLIEDLGETGSIIVYGTHEKTIIGRLKKSFPRLSARLALLEGRLVNLNTVLASNFYHPGFHGSTSMKEVLRVMVSDLSYDDLAIQNGDEVAATFVFMAWGRIVGDDAERAKRNLCEYCKRDTLALVMVHKRLIEYYNSGG
jgi:hypothetical protein